MVAEDAGRAGRRRGGSGVWRGVRLLMLALLLSWVAVPLLWPALLPTLTNGHLAAGASPWDLLRWLGPVPPVPPPPLRTARKVGLHRKVWRASRAVLRWLTTGRLETAAEKRAREAAEEAARLRTELRNQGVGWQQREHTLVEEIINLREAAAAREALEGKAATTLPWWKLLNDGAAAPTLARVRLSRQHVHVAAGSGVVYGPASAAVGRTFADAETVSEQTVSEQVRRLFGGP